MRNSTDCEELGGVDKFRKHLELHRLVGVTWLALWPVGWAGLGHWRSWTLCKVACDTGCLKHERSRVFWHRLHNRYAFRVLFLPGQMEVRVDEVFKQG